MAAHRGYGGHNSIGGGQGCPSRTGLARVGVDVQLAGWRAGCRRRRQAGNGRARNRARARLNWVSQGQRWGRCRVRRRAEWVSRPAREKNRRRVVLVVTTCSPGPMRAAQRARLWAITCTASQAAGSAFLGHLRESPRGRIHIMTLARTTAGIDKVEDAGRMDPHPGSPMRYSESSQRWWSGYLECRGRIHQDTLCNGISGTFDLSQPLALGNGFIEAMRTGGVCLHDNGGMVPTRRRNVWITPS